MLLPAMDAPITAESMMSFVSLDAVSSGEASGKRMGVV